jgi:N-glycosyltransferase
MRVLCSVLGSPSHANEMRPVARAMADAGHEVLVAVTPLLANEFTNDSNIRVTQALPDTIKIWQDVLNSGKFLTDTTMSNYSAVIEVMAGGPLIGAVFPALRSIAKEFKPDLMLRDGMELSGCLVAEELDIPHVSMPSGASNTFDPEVVAAQLNERRKTFGLPAKSDPLAIYRYGRLDCMPLRYSMAIDQLPEAIAYQQPIIVNRAESLPTWITSLDPEKPLVFGAIGAAFSMVKNLRSSGVDISAPVDPHATLRAIAGALSELHCEAILATGGLPVDDIQVAGHVRLVDWVPQPLLLQCVQLFITHSGYNSTRESILAGAPMVAIPLFSDQFNNAYRIAELGIGKRVTKQTSAEIAATCQQVLTDSAITARVRHAQREMLALPHVTEIGGKLESLVLQKC